MFKSYDVAVIGAGSSGIAAALGAAQNGAKVALAERDGFVGGMSTGGQLNLFCGRASAALYDDICRELVEKRGSRNVYDPEALKLYYLERLQNAGIDLLLHSALCDASVEGGELIEASLLCGAAKARIRANMFIDATGNGDLARLCGVPYDIGREGDGLTGPMTLMFNVGGVDDETAVYPTFGTHPELEAALARYIESEGLDPELGHVILIEGFHPGTASVNMVNVLRLNATDPDMLTRAELRAASQIPQILRFLRACVPGFENCYLLSTASYIGVRESRRFHGDFTFTERHIFEHAFFPDWAVAGVVAGPGNHNPSGSGHDRVPGPTYDGKPYTIPYRSMLAKGVNNLYLSGRCIDATHYALGGTRLMPVCMAIGQAVGTASALCARGGIGTRELDVTALQRLLIAQGVRSPESSD